MSNRLDGWEPFQILVHGKYVQPCLGTFKLGTSVTEGRPETSRDGPYRLPEVPVKL